MQMYILRKIAPIERRVYASYDALKPVIGRKKARGETDRCNLAPSRDFQPRAGVNIGARFDRIGLR